MERTIPGAIVIFYRKESGETKYLVIENTTSGNNTFVSGARELGDASTADGARREVKEELGLESHLYTLIPTTVKHVFVYGEKKPERAGCTGENTVFFVDATGFADRIHHTGEVRRTLWVTYDQVLNALSFDDLKAVFKKATREQKLH